MKNRYHAWLITASACITLALAGSGLRAISSDGKAVSHSKVGECVWTGRLPTAHAEFLLVPIQLI